MRTLILGGNGLIGRQFVNICETQGREYTATCFSRCEEGLVHFDHMDFQTLPRFFDKVKPQLVIDAVGLAGGVNYCEENPELGRKYHIDATQHKVSWCKENGAAFIFISTDYVFDGENPPYRESDAVNPLNLYGRYKLEAEQLIARELEKYIIARTTNVFGWDPGTRTPNFLMHLLRTLEKQDSMKVPSFLWGNPTYVVDLALGIDDLARQGAYGLYHIVGPGYINRYEWAKAAVQAFGLSNKTIEEQKDPPSGMIPRPLQSNLDTTKYNNTSSIKLPTIETGLKRFTNEKFLRGPGAVLSRRALGRRRQNT